MNTGLVIFFTGLSGSGKTTLANALLKLLHNKLHKPITLLDGDIVRKLLCSNLGFSKEHRDLNIQRIGWVAAEIAKHGGIAICSAIAPYETTRQIVKKMVEEVNGKFILIYLSTPLDVCELRDIKGLYKKAREGQIKQFTGVSDPYESPKDANIVIDTSGAPIDFCLDKIMSKIRL